MREQDPKNKLKFSTHTHTHRVLCAGARAQLTLTHRHIIAKNLGQMPRLCYCSLGKNKLVTQQQRVCRWSIAVAAPHEVDNMKHLNQFSDMMKNEDDKEERRLLLTAYLFRFLLQLQVETETKNQTEYPGINVEIVICRKYSFEIMKCSRSHVLFFIQRMF